MKTFTGFICTLIFPILLVGGILPEGFIEEELATGLNPIDLAISSDGRIFIAEKDGTILLWRDGKVLDAPFLELEVDDTNERGLQSVVLDPNFDQNGFLYLYYAHPNNLTNRVSRFTANGDRVLPGSETLLYEMDPVEAAIHNGGGMAFLPDGSLLFTVGDGAAQWRSQWDDQTHGKALRIWPDGTIPDDNPKIYGSGKYEAIVAKGLRNPFNVAVNEAGKVLINDVGSDKFEEINELVFESNYGWPHLEGFRTNQTVPDNYMDPLHAYNHDIGCAVVGGIFCPEDNLAFPETYRGMYFFSDYCKGYIKVLDPGTGDVIESFATEIDRPLRLIFDNQGRMYYFERAGLGGGSNNDNMSSSNGRLLRITFTGNGIPVISRNPQDQLVSIGEDATFTVSANGGRPLSYEWYVNGNQVPDADSSVLTINEAQLNQDGSEVFCIVFNPDGRDTSNTAILNVTTNTRPTPIIELLSEDEYTAGEVIRVRGIGEDPEEGALTKENFVWWIDFHHDLHTHPAMSAIGDLEIVEFNVPSIGEVDDNVWYRIYLQVTDNAGLSNLTYLDVYPKKINLTFETNPPGLELNIDGGTFTTPVVIPSVAGIEHVCVPAEFQMDEENAYLFIDWNGQTSNPQLKFDTETDLVLRANFDTYELGNGTGLQGDYYNYHNGEPVFEGDPALTRVDSVVDFLWGNSPNDSLLNKDRFLASWKGEIEPIFTGYYTIGLDYRTGARFFLDGVQMLDDWDVNPRTFHTIDSVFLMSGKKYPVIFEMNKANWEGVAILSWASGQMPMQVIPQSQLYVDNTQVDDEEPISVDFGPNPTADLVSFRLNARISASLDLHVYNLAGQLVDKQLMFFRPGLNRNDLDMTSWSDGVYIIELLEKGDSVFKRRILKH